MALGFKDSRRRVRRLSFRKKHAWLVATLSALGIFVLCLYVTVSWLSSSTAVSYSGDTDRVGYVLKSSSSFSKFVWKPRSYDPTAGQWIAFCHYGAAYLVRQLHSETAGRFKYVVNGPDQEPENPKKYNVLRHAGSIYSMTRYYEWSADFPPSPNKDGHTVSRDKVLSAARLACSYLKSSFIKPILSGDNEDLGMLAAWDEPELVGSHRRVAKLGGAGLSLLALASFGKLEPGFTKLSDLQKLAEFILYMQREDGSFFSRYSETKKRDDSWISLFYPGEAALGLVLLYEYEKAYLSKDNLKWLEAALKSLLYLARFRQGSTRVEPDHWAMLATERVMQHRDILKYDDETHEILTEHVMQVVNTLRMKLLYEEERKLYYPPDRRTTPAATRVEGLIAVIDVVKATSSTTYDDVVRTTTKMVKFLVASQITTHGERFGGLPQAITLGGLPSNGSGVSRAEKPSDAKIRIDYVQHAICGVMSSIQKDLLNRVNF